MSKKIADAVKATLADRIANTVDVMAQSQGALIEAKAAEIAAHNGLYHGLTRIWTGAGVMTEAECDAQVMPTVKAQLASRTKADGSPIYSSKASANSAATAVKWVIIGIAAGFEFPADCVGNVQKAYRAVRAWADSTENSTGKALSDEPQGASGGRPTGTRKVTTGEGGTIPTNTNVPEAVHSVDVAWRSILGSDSTALPHAIALTRDVPEFRKALAAFIGEAWTTYKPNKK